MDSNMSKVKEKKKKKRGKDLIQYQYRIKVQGHKILTDSAISSFSSPQIL